MSGAVIWALDDDPAALLVFERLLAGTGCRVVSFRDPEECLASLREARPDVFCLDLHLDSYHGPPILERMREMAPDVPVVMLTADHEPASVVESMRAGAYDYLTKPIDAGRLVQTLTHAITERHLAHRVRLLERESTRNCYGDLIGRSEPMRGLFHQLEALETSDLPVLVHGEVGSGKALVARTLHERSRRGLRPLVTMSLSMTPEPFQAGALFGYSSASARGAALSRRGLLDQAAGGTLLLRDVALLGPDAQVGLLGALEQRAFRRVGGSMLVPCDFRLLATTNREMSAEVKAGRFSEALVLRIRVFDVRVPPLRERLDDIVPLVGELLRRHAEPPPSSQSVPLLADAVDALRRYPWPGNVRELSNAMKSATLVAGGSPIGAADLPAYVQRGRGETVPRATVPRATVSSVVPVPEERLADTQSRAVLDAMARHSGNIAAAARALGITRATLYRKLKGLKESSEMMEQIT